MKEQVIKALQQYRYKVLTDSQDLEKIYRLRYECYRAEESIPANTRRIMTDAFDESENCIHVALEKDGQFYSAVRLHLLSELSHISPTLEVFPELLDNLNHQQTILDPTRFVIHPAARKNSIPLHFLALRIPFLATIFYDIDLALAPVRSEHIAFYQRFLGYEPILKPRSYPGLKKPIHLLTAKVREQRDAVLSRTPVFGPVAEIPHSNIEFPPLSGVYVASRKGDGHEAA